jgi:basic amino acid/polyamine antiporter, APA family
MTASNPTLVRAIGRWSLVAVVVNSVIGSGVFGIPSSVAGLAGEWSPLAVLLAGACIFLIVLAFAEVGSRFDEAGGPYLYTRRGFGPGLAFHIGWLHAWTRFLSGAAVLNVLVNYLAALVPSAATPLGRVLVMGGTMAVVTAINVVGVRQAAWTVNVFTVAKLLPLVALGLIGVVAFDADVAATQRVTEYRWTDAVLLLVFAYGGFESSIVAASESRDPKRDTAFALIVAMLAITAIYALVQLAVVGILPDAGKSTTPVSSAFSRVLGPAGGAVGAGAVILSVYGWLVGVALMNPRILFAMAERGELPASLARVHPRFRTPYIAVVVNSAIVLAAGLYSTFGQVAALAAVVRLGIYAVTCANVVALRRREGVAPFTLPGGPVIAAAGIVFCAWLIVTRDLSQIWILPAVVLAGALLRLLTRRGRAAAMAVEPSA